MRIAAIEAGGTKFVLGIGDEKGTIYERHVIDTTTPEETMNKVAEYFENFEFDVIGLGCFGPIDPNKKSDTYGFITKTPKTAWIDYDIVGFLKAKFDKPVGFDTDVNGAALGELVFGAAKGLDSCIYLTIGTGIGGGVVVNGEMVNGMLHPETGHIMVKRHENDTYEGKCPFHKDCLEGLAAGPAIEARWGDKAINLTDNKDVWEMESYYLAQALSTYILIVSPQKIILGGGVMHQEQLFPLIRKKVIDILAGYVQKDEIFSDDYIVPPKLGDNAGLIGAIMIGYKELNS